MALVPPLCCDMLKASDALLSAISLPLTPTICMKYRCPRCMRWRWQRAVLILCFCLPVVARLCMLLFQQCSMLYIYTYLLLSATSLFSLFLFPLRHSVVPNPAYSLAPVVPVGRCNNSLCRRSIYKVLAPINSG